MENELSALCRICNIHEAKYVCPRCSYQTCSLPCSRRHKLWKSCSGIRDPTVFKPKSQLATPSGVDHDYNFLHSIEHRIQRSEKLIIEERGLVGKDELELARAGEEDHHSSRRKEGPRARREVPIQNSLKQTRTTIWRAPKGMRRNLENETSWSSNNKTINWQVEWIREGDAGRILSKAFGNQPIGEVYATIMEAERIKELPEEERRMMMKKRKAGGPRQRIGRRKRLKLQMPKECFAARYPALQDPETSAWSFCSPETSFREDVDEETEGGRLSLPPSHHLYLLRPHTPSCYPKVLVPIDPSQTLEVILQGRLVLEFPTIYVLCVASADFPDQFMVEDDFLIASREAKFENPDIRKESNVEDSDSGTSTSVSQTSAGGSDTDEEMEDGEIEEALPAVWGGRPRVL